MVQRALSFGFFPQLETVNQNVFSPKEVERIEQFKHLIGVEVTLAQEQGVSERDIIKELAEKTAQLYHLAYALDKGWPDPARQEIFA
jgi:hypothetical protein